jgi:hypothetical protein
MRSTIASATEEGAPGMAAIQGDEGGFGSPSHAALVDPQQPIAETWSFEMEYHSITLPRLRLSGTAT